MNLIQLGDFVLNSGKKARWKLECDQFIEDNLAGLVELIRQMVGPFSSVEGVPRGGLRLAEMLKLYRVCGKCGEINNEHRESSEGCYDFAAGSHPHLIVDDVLTTGGSITRLRDERERHWFTQERTVNVLGAVVFARGCCPPWTKAVFQLPAELWLKE